MYFRDIFYMHVQIMPVWGDSNVNYILDFHILKSVEAVTKRTAVTTILYKYVKINPLTLSYKYLDIFKFIFKIKI